MGKAISKGEGRDDRLFFLEKRRCREGAEAEVAQNAARRKRKKDSQMSNVVRRGKLGH